MKYYCIYSGRAKKKIKDQEPTVIKTRLVIIRSWRYIMKIEHANSGWLASDMDYLLKVAENKIKN